MRGYVPRRDARRAILALAVATLALGVGCSLIVNRADSQCSTDGDCAKFAGTACVAGGCVPKVAPPVDASAKPDSADTATEITSCETTQECLPEHQGINWICRRQDGQCVSVISPDCATIVGPYLRDDVVLVGALLPLVGPHASTGQALQDSIRLAIGDFADYGLPPIADGGARRPLAVVFCNEEEDIDRAATHLRDDLRVPVIWGTAFSATTLDVARDVTVVGGQLLVSPAAGSNLAAVASSGLVWRTIADDTLQVHAIAKTLTLLEPSLQAAHAAVPVRVAVVYKDDDYGNGFDSNLRNELRFNGKSTADNGADFLHITYGNPDDPGASDPEIAYSDAIDAVRTQLPDMVILAGYTTAVTRVLTGIEANWPSGQARPHYLLSNGMEVKELLTLLGDGAHGDLRARILGTSPGDNESNSNRSLFDVRYGDAYKDGGVPESYAAANAFDAVYATAFGIAATRNSDLVGKDVTAGLRRALDADGGAGAPAAIDVRPTSIAAAFTAIQAGTPIALRGVTGPLSFDATGGVTSDVQIWCVAARSATALGFKASGLFYQAADGALHGAIDASCTN